MKIVFLDESTANLNGDLDLSRIRKIGDLKTYSLTLSEEDVISRAEGAECMIVNKVPVTKKVVEALPGLRHVAVLATGYNNIDLDACRKAGVTVSNVRGYANACVPQHVFALILNLMTRAHQYNNDILNGEWAVSDSFTLLKYPTFELAGKTLGVIGFGSIGKQVARIGEAFGMKIMMHRRSQKPEGRFSHFSLDEIYENSDVISINCPLTEDNKYMIDWYALNQMKSSAILINTARGPLVNQHDLARALNEKIIAGAGIDVLDDEPPQDNPLLAGVENLIMTPHSAWSTREARQRLVDDVSLTLESLKNGVPRNLL